MNLVSVARLFQLSTLLVKLKEPIHELKHIDPNASAMMVLTVIFFMLILINELLCRFEFTQESGVVL